MNTLKRAQPICHEDRRADGRTLLLYRSATITSGTRQGIAIVRNLSAGGLMAQSRMEIAEGDAVTIELASRMPLRGIVVWTDGTSFGMQFDERVQLATVLGGMTDRKKTRRRIPRIAMSTPARVVHLDHHVGVTVLNISVTGLRFESDHPFAHGLIILDLGDLGHRPARILWNEDNNYGCAFIECLSWDALTQWAASVAGVSLD